MLNVVTHDKVSAAIPKPDLGRYRGTSLLWKNGVASQTSVAQQVIKRGAQQEFHIKINLLDIHGKSVSIIHYLAPWQFLPHPTPPASTSLFPSFIKTVVNCVLTVFVLVLCIYRHVRSTNPPLATVNRPVDVS